MGHVSSLRGLGVRVLCAVALVAGIGGSVGAQTRPTTFKDPRPPKVNQLQKMAAATAKEYRGLRAHAAPRPLAKGAVTEDVTSFLGSRRDLRSSETPLRTVWPASGPPLLWEMRRGVSYASPVVKGDRLVYIHRVGDKAHVECLQTTTGKRYWRFSYPCTYKGRYIRNSGSRATPVISDGLVYVHGVEGMLHCLELTTGRVAWKRNLKLEFDAPDNFFGMVSSPIIYGNLLIQNLGARRGPCVAAFDKTSGRLVWGTGTKWGASCSSPVIGSVHGQDKLFVLAGGESRPPKGGLMVLDPKTGALDFDYPFRSRTFESVVASVPVVGRDWVFLSSAYGVGSAVLSLKKDGGFERWWHSRSVGLQFSNGIHVDGRMFVVDGSSDRAGAVVCLDAKTGKEVFRTDLDWEETVLLNGKKRKVSFSVGEGSLLQIPDGFLCLGDNGHLLALQLTPTGVKIRSRSWLFKANETWTPLVVSHGLLFVCQNKKERFGTEPPRLLCYDLRGQN